MQPILHTHTQAAVKQTQSVSNLPITLQFIIITNLYYREQASDCWGVKNNKMPSSSKQKQTNKEDG